MVDVRKILMIFVIGIIFAVLVFAFIEAVYPSPESSDYCNYMNTMPIKEPAPPTGATGCKDVLPTVAEQDNCTAVKGSMDYTRDENNCIVRYACNTCQESYNQAFKQHQMIVFYVSAVLSLIAIFLGLFLPAKENSLNEWVGTGFMLGGIIALFSGTIMSYNSLDRIIRPIVLVVELGLVIFVSYKWIGNLREDKKEQAPSDKKDS